MSIYLTLFLILFGMIGLAAVLPFQIIPRIIRRAAQWGILDFPDRRKAHAKPTPRLGGLSLMPAVWLGCAIALLLSSAFDIQALSANLSLFTKAVIGFLIGSTGIFLLGMVDDFRRLTATHKLLSQILISAVVVHFLPMPHSVLGFELNPWLIQTVFFGWLVIIPNSVNLMDGVDGLTSSMCSAFLLTCALMSLLLGELGWLLILLPTLAAVLSFLRFNWKPARIFLGDSGSLLLGFAVAHLSLLMATTPASGENWNPLISLFLVFVWILDTSLAIFRRYFGKIPSAQILVRRSRGTYLNLHRNALANIVRPDKKHLHHQLLQRGYSAPAVALFLSAAALAFSMISLSIWSHLALGHTTWSSGLSSFCLYMGLMSIASLFLRALYPLRKSR